MPATQIERPFRFKTPLGDDALLLESFDGYERVSTPFRYLLHVLSPDPNIDMEGLLTKPLVLTVRSAGREDPPHSRADQPHEAAGSRRGRAWRLTKSRWCPGSGF